MKSFFTPGKVSCEIDQALILFTSGIYMKLTVPSCPLLSAQVCKRPRRGKQAAGISGQTAPEQSVSHGHGQQRRLLIQPRLATAQQDQVQTSDPSIPKIPLTQMHHVAEERARWNTVEVGDTN